MDVEARLSDYSDASRKIVWPFVSSGDRWGGDGDDGVCNETLNLLRPSEEKRALKQRLRGAMQNRHNLRLCDIIELGRDVLWS